MAPTCVYMFCTTISKILTEKRKTQDYSYIRYRHGKSHLIKLSEKFSLAINWFITYTTSHLKLLSTCP